MRLGLHQNQAQDKRYRPASIATSGTGTGNGYRQRFHGLFFFFVILFYLSYFDTIGLLAPCTYIQSDISTFPKRPPEHNLTGIITCYNFISPSPPQRNPLLGVVPTRLETCVPDPDPSRHKVSNPGGPEKIGRPATTLPRSMESSRAR